MPLPADRTPPDLRALAERMGRLERGITELRAARRLEHAAVGDTMLDTALSVARLGWYNVKDYGAKANAGNAGPAIQTAIEAARAAGGGTVYIPAGTYTVTPGAGTAALSITGTGVRLVGDGRGNTVLRKGGPGVLLSMSGPASDLTGASHTRYCTLADLTLNGNGQTGLLLQLYYTNNCVFRDLFFTSNSDVCVDSAEFWDSHFVNCVFESSGGAANSVTPMVWLRNSAAASGYGYSPDTVNMIRFYACRWENFFNGAVRIEQGPGNTSSPNGIYLTDNKMESSSLRGGSHLHTADECIGVFVDGLYCFAGNFFSGYSTPQVIITWSPQLSCMENVLIANGPVATVNSGVDLFSPAGQISALRNVIGHYVTTPTNGHIFYEASSSGGHNLQNCVSGNGTQAVGTIPTAYEGHSPFHQNAGPVSDGQFARTPLNGHMGIDTANVVPYFRVGGTWQPPAPFVKEGTANARMGTATLNGTTAVTVNTTAVTANTRIFLTIQAPGGTPGTPYVSGRTAGTSFDIKSSAGDTSTVAWLAAEPA